MGFFLCGDSAAECTGCDFAVEFTNCGLISFLLYLGSILGMRAVKKRPIHPAVKDIRYERGVLFVALEAVKLPASEALEVVEMIGLAAGRFHARKTVIESVVDDREASVSELKTIGLRFAEFLSGCVALVAYKSIYSAFVAGSANAHASQIGSDLSMRAFDTLDEARAWIDSGCQRKLNDAPGARIALRRCAQLARHVPL